MKTKAFVPATNSVLWFDSSASPATKPLATVAYSGVYSDLTSKPTLFSGVYSDLTGKPSLPVIVTLSASSATNGSYTWVFGTPFAGVPKVTCQVVVNDTGSVYNMWTISRSANSCVFQISKTTTLLGISFIPGALTFDAVATYP